MTSDTVRFQIEDLLYRAPRFIATGETLAGEQKSAQAQLTSMGAFWGDDDAGKAFGKVYEPAQRVILELVSLIASGIDGVGNGIATMAKVDGITEGDITLQIQHSLRDGRQGHSLHPE